MKKGTQDPEGLTPEQQEEVKRELEKNGSN